MNSPGGVVFAMKIPAARAEKHTRAFRIDVRKIERADEAQESE